MLGRWPVLVLRRNISAPSCVTLLEGAPNMLRQCAPLLGAVLGLSGCMIHHSAGPAQHEYATYDVNGAKELRVKLKMGAGELRVGSGTDRLARADFEYNVPEWKPEVSYDGGVLRISQPEG